VVLFPLLYIFFIGAYYPLFLILIGFGLWIAPFKSFTRFKKMLSYVLFMISLPLLFIFPVYSMPNPTGDLDIGTMTFEVSNPLREEIYGDGDSIRQFNFQIFYPAVSTSTSKYAPWLLDGARTSEALSVDFGFPGFLLSQTQFIESHSVLDADILSTNIPYPVVIISHGWSGTKYLHSDLAETLASEGYIAITIEHTYGSVASVIDGQVISKQADALSGFDDTLNGLKSNTRLMRTYGLDIIDTIDYISQLNVSDDSIFYQQIDLDNIGVVGHSTGGGGAVYAALQDSRIKALIGLDAWVEPISDTLENINLNIPSIFLRSETWEIGPNNLVLYPMLQNASDASLYQIDGTTHYDFAMVYMYTSLSKVLGFSGSIQTDRMLDILFSVNHTFFDKHLKDDQVVLDLSDYEDVTSIDYTN
jgi:pimeloyl-ACP methyl ester carboxylesterase